MLPSLLQNTQRRPLLILGLTLLFAWSGSAAVALRALQGPNQNPNVYEEEHRPTHCETRTVHHPRRPPLRVAGPACPIARAIIQPVLPRPQIRSPIVLPDSAADLHNGIGGPLLC